jgi:hypothetical protein
MLMGPREPKKGKRKKEKKRILNGLVYANPLSCSTSSVLDPRHH